MLFGMSVLPMTKGRLQELDRIQRKMMRRIVGSRRIEDEDWSIIMKRIFEDSIGMGTDAILL